jgi:diguanylate cyclase (GGDEF)-like protein
LLYGWVRGWVVWTIPLPARLCLLTVEITAVVVAVTLLLTQAVTGPELLRVGVLAVLGIGYVEAAARIERVKHYLGAGSVFSDQMAVWTFAAALIAPAGWADMLVVVLYAHATWQRRRDRSGLPYRAVFTAATVMLAVPAASWVLTLAGAGDPLRGGLTGPATLMLALVVYTVVNFGLLMTGMWLTARPPSMRPMLPAPDVFAYEMATLFLGMIVAEFLLHRPALTPVAVLLAAFVHRSSLVNALQHSLRTDTKTGLLTHAAWTEHTHTALTRAHQQRTPASVLFCDLDHFKTLNDTHGHLAGDQVLRAVADCLRRELREHDGLGRFGGEEFVILLELPDDDADLVAARLRRAVAALTPAPGIRVTASIGVAHHHPDDTNTGPDGVQDLVARADAAMLRAKANGRDQVHIAA